MADDSVQALRDAANETDSGPRAYELHQEADAANPRVQAMTRVDLDSPTGVFFTDGEDQALRVATDAAVLLLEDPLRVLLADEEALLEFAAHARHKAAGYDTWDDWPEWAQKNWRRETRTFCGAVLAALREVAGL